MSVVIPCRLVCLTAVSQLAFSSASAAGRPNVVMIMTDNHGAWTLGCYGNKDIRTPNIDRMAAEGTLFDNAFASNPVCSPTRATTLTGLIPSQHGVHCFLRLKPLQMGPDARNTLEDFTSLPEVLKAAGYRCGLVGKWHLGANISPQESLDDYWITMPHGGTSTFYDARIIEDGKERTEPEYLTDFWTKHALKYIDQRAAEKEQPFFLFLAYNGPYALSRLLLREGRNQHAEFYRGKQLPSFPRETPHPWQLHNRDYQNNPVSIQRVATEVSGVDDGVGNVMSALKAHGLDDNTIVIFLADQGWVGGHGGFFGMGDHTQPKTARDGMMKIPMIWRHPNQIAAGKRSRKLVANYDVMPTLLEHLGLKSPWEGDTPAKPVSPGTSFTAEFDAVSDNATQADDAIFYEFETLRCIRTDKWKYVHRFPNGPHELYDLKNDPDEFNNLYQPNSATMRHLDEPRGAKSEQNEPPSGRNDHLVVQQELKQRLDTFYAEYAEPKYDLYNGGGSQTIIYDGIQEEIAQQDSIAPPPLPEGFQPQVFTLPDGFSAELVAGPPMVTHPTMGCFDDAGRLFICDGAGVNMSAEELEKNLPNQISMLEDHDGDGVFDKSTVFADKLTFPMGGTWHDGALYVASPPNIWRFEDTTGDGVADKRDILVDSFGYTGNAASIHGCFFSPDGRLYWCDGYHGHEFKDADGKVVSKRKGSYIFSCWPDGSDVRIHCGGGMDNPVEVDFTDEGDVIGTVNILYTRPRVDCLVHWQYGGAYPHREAVLDEIRVTGDLLGPIHRFGHVAISGTTRYRSGVMDHRWGNNFFATQFNVGKVVRLELEHSGSTYSATEREFLSCGNRDFHPTDVIEDADGSLLVVDTGGWFYRGCPTSQMSKPDVLGGIYRIRRDGMTTVPDPRGRHTDWTARTNSELMRDLKDSRFAVREKIVQECVRRGESIVDSLHSTIRSADIFARRNAIWASSRIFHNTKNEKARQCLLLATNDRDSSIRQAAWHAIAATRAFQGQDFQTLAGIKNPTQPSMAHSLLFGDASPGVRREIHNAMALADLTPADYMSFVWMYGGQADAFKKRNPDREERHAFQFLKLEISKLSAAWSAKSSPTESIARIAGDRESLIVEDQISVDGLPAEVLQHFIAEGDSEMLRSVSAISGKRIAQGKFSDEQQQRIYQTAADRIVKSTNSDDPMAITDLRTLMQTFGTSHNVGLVVGRLLQSPETQEKTRVQLFSAIASTTSQQTHPSWNGPLQDAIRSPNHALRIAAISAVGTVGVSELAEQLVAVAKDSTESPQVRLAALTAVSRDRKTMAAYSILPLLMKLARNGSPAEQSTAAQLLGASSLTAPELLQVAPLLASVGPQQLVDLVKLFKRSLPSDVATAFLDHVEVARSLSSLPRLDVSEVVKRFPAELHDRANALLDRMHASEQAKVLKLDALVGKLNQGDAMRGKDVFFSEKAKCATCHVVADKGKRVGPDLTTIGANRAAKDLLESIIFPSATIVRQYEPYTLVTTNGRSYSGLVIKDTSASVTVQQSSGDPVTVARSEIEELVPATVSIMPKGLEEALTEQQIADLVAWMQTLR